MENKIRKTASQVPFLSNTLDDCEHTSVFLVQKVPQVKEISFNNDKEGNSQQH